jgi:copper resistance protein C
MIIMRFDGVLNLGKRRLGQAVFALTTFFAAPVAFAHTAPVNMMPPADATVASPKSIMIHFSGALEPKFSTITVTNAEGHLVNKEQSVISDENKVMTVALPTLSPGVYTVHWVGVSVDTHRSQGDYKFTVK